MSKFVGREYELKLLNSLLEKDSASLVVMYGRRRIGKSRLAEEFANNHNMYLFSGLSPRKDMTKKHQMEDFAKQISKQFKTKLPKYSDWNDAFIDLASKTQKGRTVILLDEITWMSIGDKDFLGKLKNAWDLYFKKNSKLILILCGSVSAWINQHIICNTGFYGRISLKLHLKELPLEDCKYFWKKYHNKISSIEKLKVLSVTGGIPKYLEEINPNISAEENIKRLCFSESGLLFNEYEQIFSSMLSKTSDYYRYIVEMLIDQKLEQKDIIKNLQVKSGGNISSYLKELEDAGFIKRDYNWDFKNGKISKNSQYRLTDNYLRFYFKYILPNIHKIYANNFKLKSLSTLPGWTSIMGLQIENLILNNTNALHKILEIPEEDIICSGAYFQRGTKKFKGCQIDYMVQTKFHGMYLCEIKFSKNIIKNHIIEEMEEKINSIKIPKNTSIRPVLITASDVDDKVYDSGYFNYIVNIEELL